MELNGYDSDKIQEKITKLFATGKLRAESFAYIRGRNITNSFIILDEAQKRLVHKSRGLLPAPEVNHASYFAETQSRLITHGWIATITVLFLP